MTIYILFVLEKSRAVDEETAVAVDEEEDVGHVLLLDHLLHLQYTRIQIFNSKQREDEEDGDEDEEDEYAEEGSVCMVELKKLSDVAACLGCADVSLVAEDGEPRRGQAQQRLKLRRLPPWPTQQHIPPLSHLSLLSPFLTDQN